MTGFNKAANVLLARCRARYGRRLTMPDIEQLVGCRTVPEAAALLKKTGYASSLAGLDVNSLHRRPFEAALNRHLMNEFLSLSRCEESVGDWFGGYLLMRAEINQIMSFLWLLSSGRQNEFILSVPETFIQRAGIEPAALASCTDYDSFLSAMRRSQFGGVLRAMRPLPGEPIDCALIEHGLYARFYDAAFELVKSHCTGKARTELLDILGTQKDVSNFRAIYRLKRYYSADPATVRSFLLNGEHRIKHRVLLEMINAPDAETVMELFVTRTPYGRRVNKGILYREGGLETATSLLVQSRARELMRASTNPTTVLLAYIILSETEVHDIAAIVEGIYYGLTREAILDLITIDEMAS